ncbi:MAG: hypothetical protein IPH75_14035 [bacterium]|nr:hypothetical protein [bacterium]
MSNVHFDLAEAKEGYTPTLQFIAMEGAAAALVAQIEKGNLSPHQPEDTKKYIKLVKEALLDGTGIE